MHLERMIKMPRTCEIPNCEKQTVARNMCMGHYRRILRNGTIELSRKRIKHTVETIIQKLCSVDGCERKHYGNGLCMNHLRRVGRSGDAGSPEIRQLKKQGEICKHIGCNKKPVSNDFCNLHLMRFKKHGDSNILLKRGRPRKHAN
jgi:hypothetical protein